MAIRGIWAGIKRNWLFSSLLSIILGIILMVFPGMTTQLVCAILGGIAILFGLSRVMRYFQQHSIYPEFLQGDLLSGLLCTGAGLFIALRPEIVVSLIPIIFGMFILAGGISGMVRAMDARRAGYAHWAIPMVLAVLALALSLMLMINPFASIKITVMVIGGCLIYEGITDLIAVQMTGKRIEAWKKAANR